MVLEMDPYDEANFASLAASYERSGQFQKALDLLLPCEEEYGDDEGFQEQLKRLQQKIKEEIL
jgi:DNA-binding SARP family transcriptional activator